MTTVWALVKRELYGYFASPIAYVVLAAFLFLYGLYFFGELEIFLDPRTAQAGTLNVNQDMIRWLFSTTAVIVMFVLPLVTMRSFSEELRSGTIEICSRRRSPTTSSCSASFSARSLSTR